MVNYLTFNMIPKRWSVVIVKQIVDSCNRELPENSFINLNRDG